MKIAIIGGGAAGFFAAIATKENYPEAEVIIYEKSQKLLSKVKISGGGRCNVTNSTTSIKELSEAYPRGGKKLKNLFPIFGTKETMRWFEERGVSLVIQTDNCVFPKSQDSQSIIDCFLNECRRLDIKIEVGKGIKALKSIEDKVQLVISTIDKVIIDTVMVDKAIVATGGSPKRTSLEWLENLGHKIEDPVPSLFTFNMPNESIKELMGIVVENTLVNVQGTKLKSDGPLLITHWGMSGPAILKLSAFGARTLNEKNYKFNIQVNWVNEPNNQLVLAELNNLTQEHTNKQLSSIRPYYIPDRLWLYLLAKSGMNPSKKWNELGKKGINKLVSTLTNDIYLVEGKTTFKEEFVTCGGVSLESIDFTTLQSRAIPNVYFAGELLDIDGITGGYNFQAAWTTAFIAAKLN